LWREFFVVPAEKAQDVRWGEVNYIPTDISGYRSSKGTTSPANEQKSLYAYFFVGNDYYPKLGVMHFLFFTAWTANKKKHIMSYCEEISKKNYLGPRKDSLLIT